MFDLFLKRKLVLRFNLPSKFDICRQLGEHDCHGRCYVPNANSDVLCFPRILCHVHWSRNKVNNLWFEWLQCDYFSLQANICNDHEEGPHSIDIPNHCSSNSWDLPLFDLLFAAFHPGFQWFRTWEWRYLRLCMPCRSNYSEQCIS